MLAEMRDAGMTIGSHTKTHPFLTNESDQLVLQETEDSRRELERRLGVPVGCFAYPGGMFNTAVVRAVATAGYRYAFTNCTGCGLTCDTTNSNGAACSGVTCTYTSCKAGFANCSVAVPYLAGCETSTSTDVNNCGGCGVKCDTVTSNGASCVAGKCDYTSCSKMPGSKKSK